jgi:hypothetical protein
VGEGGSLKSGLHDSTLQTLKAQSYERSAQILIAIMFEMLTLNAQWVILLFKKSNISCLESKQ